MKFNISVTDLQYALRTVKDVVPTGPNIMSSASLIIEASGNRAVFNAYNPELVAKVTVKIDPVKDGKAAVEASALYSAVSHFKPRKENGVGTSDITLSVGSRSRKLQVSAKTRYASGVETPHKRVFALMGTGFFPDIPDPEQTDLTFEVPARILMDGIDSVSYALSKDKNQLLFTGLLFQLKDSKLSLFATNGLCLAEYSAPFAFEGEPVRIVLPGTFASKVAKSFFDTDSLLISLTHNMIFIRTPNMILGGALIRDEYPDYTKVIPKPTTFISLDKYMLLDNLVNLSYESANVDESRVTVQFKGKEASLKCSHSTNGGIPTDFEGDIAFDCNLNLLASSIKNVFGNELKIGIKEPKMPLQFSSGEEVGDGPQLKCVLVPLSV